MNLRSACLLFLMPCFAHAAPAANGFKVDLSVTAMQSDNGAKAQTQASEKKISERQSIYELGVANTYSNDWALFNAAYDLSEQTYSENSQPDYTRLVGSLQLDLGNNYYPLHLRVAHANESLLNSPDALDLSANREERATLTVEPSLRVRLGGADSLRASVRNTDVSYDLQAQKDSRSQALELAWQRAISKVNSFNLSLTSSDTEFEYRPLFDYTLESALIRYDTRLKRLNYSIAAGANKVTQTQQNLAFTKPHYDVAASYNNVFNTLSVQINRAVSDSSAGSAAMFGSATESTREIDIVDVTVITLAWATTRLCEKCAVNIYAGKNKENYQALLDDAIVKSMGASLSYRILRNGSLALRVSENKREFEAGSASASFAYKNYELGYNHQFMSKLAMNVFARKLRRDSVSNVSTYNENSAGLTVTYSF